jgi:hypothetical protein
MYRVPGRSAHGSIVAFRTYGGRATSRSGIAEGNVHQVSAFDVGPGTARAEGSHLRDSRRAPRNPREQPRPPALALGLDKPNRRTMDRPPRPSGERILFWPRLTRMALTAAVMAGGTLAVLAVTDHSHGTRYATTLAFTTFGLFQVANAFKEAARLGIEVDGVVATSSTPVSLERPPPS